MDDHEHEDDGTVYCWLCHRVMPEEDAEEFDTVEALAGTMTVVTYFKCKDGCPA